MQCATRSRLACLFAFLLLTVSGCDLISRLPDGNGVVFRTDQLSYEPGNEVQLRLKNNSNETFRVGSLCELRLQKRTQGEWQPVWKQKNCFTAVIEVEPGEQEEHVATLPNDLSSGLYRYELGGAKSNAFSVGKE